MSDLFWIIQGVEASDKEDVGEEEGEQIDPLGAKSALCTKIVEIRGTCVSMEAN